jgi:hypothetical protein
MQKKNIGVFMKYLAGMAFLLSVFFTAEQHAALPPLYQSIREIDAVLSHEYLRSSEFTAEPILDVKKIENGYLVETAHYYLMADVIYKETSHIGPMQFEVHFQPAVAK